jgi:cation/acetate symporter
MVIGGLSSVILIGLSSTVMVDILHCEYCIFPFKNPGLFTIPGAFIIGILVSLLTKDPNAQHKYSELLKKMSS